MLNKLFDPKELVKANKPIGEIIKRSVNSLPELDMKLQSDEDLN